MSLCGRPLPHHSRLLRLEVGELERSIGVTRRLVPSVPLLDNDVAALQKALFEARREAEALSLALENPSNQGRWRLLEGKIPDREELSAKIQVRDQAGSALQVPWWLGLAGDKPRQDCKAAVIASTSGLTWR